MRASRLVPIAKAADLVQVSSDDPRQWLIRRLKRLKRETGVDLLVPTGEGKLRPRYRVSMARLRRHLPELFDVEGERDDYAKAAAVAFSRIERKLETIDDRIDSTEQRLGAIHVSIARNRQKPVS